MPSDDLGYLLGKRKLTAKETATVCRKLADMLVPLNYNVVSMKRAIEKANPKWFKPWFSKIRIDKEIKKVQQEVQQKSNQAQMQGQIQNPQGQGGKK